MTEPRLVGVRTEPGPDGHTHVATFTDAGNGQTSTDAGHCHRVRWLEVEKAAGHVHELSDERVDVFSDEDAA